MNVSWFDIFWMRLDMALADLKVLRAIRIRLYFQLKQIFELS